MVSELTVIVKWLAHAGFRIKAAGRTIYVDLEKHGDASERADLVLVTHSHTDHCDPDKIKQVRTNNTVVIAPADCAKKIGGDTKTLRVGEETTVFDSIKIKAVEAYNTKRFRSPGQPFHPKGFGVGYLVTVEGKTIYHAGDTDLISEMSKLGHVDVALLPSGDTYTMDNSEAAEAAITMSPNVAIPMHRWKTNPEEFKEKVAAKSKIRVLVLREGEEFQVP